MVCQLQSSDGTQEDQFCYIQCGRVRYDRAVPRRPLPQAVHHGSHRTAQNSFSVTFVLPSFSRKYFCEGSARCVCEIMIYNRANWQKDVLDMIFGFQNKIRIVGADTVLV